MHGRPWLQGTHNIDISGEPLVNYGRFPGAVRLTYPRAILCPLANNTRYECRNIGSFARTLSPDHVLIDPSFWNQTDDPHGLQRFAQYRAGTILHEVMHQYFLSFTLHDGRERRRNNAHCLTAFALRASGIPPRPHHIRQMRGPARLMAHGF
jgi:hypothetical protein